MWFKKTSTDCRIESGNAQTERNEMSEDTLTVLGNSDCVPVYFFGITDEYYYSLMEQLTSRLFSFALHGIGWISLVFYSKILNIFRPMGKLLYGSSSQSPKLQVLDQFSKQ